MDILIVVGKLLGLAAMAFSMVSLFPSLMLKISKTADIQHTHAGNIPPSNKSRLALIAIFAGWSLIFFHVLKSTGFWLFPSFQRLLSDGNSEEGALWGGLMVCAFALSIFVIGRCLAWSRHYEIISKTNKESRAYET